MWVLIVLVPGLCMQFTSLKSNKQEKSINKYINEK